MYTILGFFVGFASGWATRSFADSPHDAEVKLLELAHAARTHLLRWTLIERERLEDIWAEALSRTAQQDQSGGAPAYQVQPLDRTAP
jgi:hypothetical protein